MRVNLLLLHLSFIVTFLSLVHHLLVFTSAKMGDHHILSQPAVDLYRSLVRSMKE